MASLSPASRVIAAVRGAVTPLATRRVGIIAAAGGLLAVAASCARQGAPTGGLQDRVPPVVLRVEPDTFAVVEPGTDRFRVWFSERISEQPDGGSLVDAVQISPEIPGMQVKHRRDGLDIEIPDGLAPDVAYAIRIRPVIRDLFNNSMVAPFEWVVSTGRDATPNAVVGQIWDRVTGDFLPDIRVVLGSGGVDELGDSVSGTVRYAARSADEGIYAVRFLPPGPLSLLAYQDRNRNRVMDPGEPRGVAGTAVGAADTVFLSLPILVPDTTAARAVRAEPVDSTVLRILFDDALDPLVPVDGVQVTFVGDTVPPEDSTAAPVVPESFPAVVRIYHESRWSQVRDSLVANADTVFRRAVDSLLARGDSLAADSLRQVGAAVVPGGSDRGPARTGGGGVGGGSDLLPDGTPRPATSLVVLLDRSLPLDTALVARVAGAVNVNGLSSGGGSARLVWTVEVPETAPDSLAVDSTATDSTPSDTAGTDSARVDSVGGRLPMGAEREAVQLSGLGGPARPEPSDTVRLGARR